VLVDTSGRIVATAPEAVLELPEEVIEHDLGAAVLLPGLVNTHAHPDLAMFRGFLEDLAFPEWIMRLVSARRTLLREGDDLAAARWSMVESIRAGITTMGATEASGAAARALSESGLRGTVYQEVFGPDPRQADESIGQLVTDLERIRGFTGERVRLGVSPHAPYTVSDALYRRVAAFARDEGLPMALHIAESRPERELVVAAAGAFAAALRARGIEIMPRGRTPIAMLDHLGILDERPLLIHCVDLDEEDIGRIAATGCSVAHCPVANAKLGHGLAPVGQLRAAGVTVGLGTDSVASNNRLDLLEEARCAALLRRAADRSHVALSAPELLRLCTIDGARALGLDDRIGTLEVGKDADLCAVKLDSPSATPIFDPVATLFHSARGSDVCLTVVAGEILFEAGEFHTVDLGAALRGLEAAAGRLRALP
jgi:5-methylthioadenosine/S-adenosylhomocysteine deaminase